PMAVPDLKTRGTQITGTAEIGLHVPATALAAGASDIGFACRERIRRVSGDHREATPIWRGVMNEVRRTRSVCNRERSPARKGHERDAGDLERACLLEEVGLGIEVVQIHAPEHQAPEGFPVPQTEDLGS